MCGKNIEVFNFYENFFFSLYEDRLDNLNYKTWQMFLVIHGWISQPR